MPDRLLAMVDMTNKDWMWRWSHDVICCAKPNARFGNIQTCWEPVLRRVNLFLFISALWGSAAVLPETGKEPVRGIISSYCTSLTGVQRWGFAMCEFITSHFLRALLITSSLSITLVLFAFQTIAALRTCSVTWFNSSVWILLTFQLFLYVWFQPKWNDEVEWGKMKPGRHAVKR